MNLPALTPLQATEIVAQKLAALNAAAKELQAAWAQLAAVIEVEKAKQI